MLPPPAIRPLPTDGPYRPRLAGALAVSLLVHALILSLQFGIPGVSLPALELPWRDRRAQAVDLHVVLAPPSAPAAAEPPASAIERPAANQAPTGLRLVPMPAVPAIPAAKPRKRRSVEKPVAARTPRARIKRETPVIALNVPHDSDFNMPAPAVDELPPQQEPEADAPPASVALPEPEPAPVEDTAAKEGEREEQKQAEEASRRAAVLALQQQREDALRREHEEAARRAAELEEKQRAETLRLQAEQQRQQREAMELQARKQAEAAAEAARERERQAEELAARRKAEADAEAARASAARREPELALGDSPVPGTRIDPLPRGLTGGGLAGRALEQARRNDVLRNDAPAARPSDSGAERPRRHSILGSRDADVGVMMYVESWRLKIERNGSIMYPRAAVDKAHGDPVVTVTVRSDGSVEEVVIHRSSGRPELDEAVHRIVRVNARYSAFPPELARRFDVIEIRRVWNFDDRLRILEEVR